MLFFFGTRVSKIKIKKIDGNTACPYCSSVNSFVATTYGRYFHIFWIPMLPISKETILECSHCKKSYRENEFPQDIKQALLQSNQIDPAKRPLWHGLGCLIIAGLFLISTLISIASAIFLSKNDVKDVIDSRTITLQEDVDKTTSSPDQQSDFISYNLKNCIDDEIVGIDTDKIQYYSKIDDNNLLVLLKIDDLKKASVSSRKEIIYAVEDCLSDFVELENFHTYIGVDGKWNMVLVKTPNREDLDGNFADKTLLLPFYGPEPIKPDYL